MNMNIISLVLLGVVACLFFYFFDSKAQKKAQAQKKALQKANEEAIRKIVHSEFVNAGLAVEELE